MQLFSTPDYPALPDPALHRVKVEDSISLRAFSWAPLTVRVRGTICVMQGRAECVEKYFETITELRQRGFHVVVFDWRGQGGSDRLTKNPAKGHVKSFKSYLQDLKAIETDVLAPLPRPWFGLAHSMGAAIALIAARQNLLPFDRLVALSPMIELSIIPHRGGASWLAEIMCLSGFGKAFSAFTGPESISLKPFAGNRLCGDEKRYARNAQIMQDHAAFAGGLPAIGGPTYGWVRAAYRWMRLFEEPHCATFITMPTLVLAAALDQVVSTPAIERFSSRLKAGHAIVIQNSRHEILQETDAIRSQFWAAFDAFIPGTLKAELTALKG
jgi:lysophospholipase